MQAEAQEGAIDLDVPLSPQQDNRVRCSLHVADLDPRVTEPMLHALFRDAPGLWAIKIPRDRSSGVSLGYAYLTFETDDQAMAVLEEFAFRPGPFGRTLRITATRQGVRKDLRLSGCNVYVRNLDETVECRDLYLLFKPYGTVVSVRIVKDENTGAPKGYGFVCFSEAFEANRAVEALNGFMFRNRQLHTSAALQKEPSNPPVTFADRLASQKQKQQLPPTPAIPWSSPPSGPMYFLPFPMQPPPTSQWVPAPGYTYLPSAPPPPPPNHHLLDFMPQDPAFVGPYPVGYQMPSQYLYGPILPPNAGQIGMPTLPHARQLGPPGHRGKAPTPRYNRRPRNAPVSPNNQFSMKDLEEALPKETSDDALPTESATTTAATSSSSFTTL